MEKSKYQIKGEELEKKALEKFGVKDIREGLKPFEAVSGLTAEQYSQLFKIVGSKKAQEKAERAVNMGGLFWSVKYKRLMFVRNLQGEKERVFKQLTFNQFKKSLKITING